MSQLDFSQLNEDIQKLNEGSIQLYFITRKLKEGIKPRDKMLSKFEFDSFQIDIDKDIRKELFLFLKNEIKNYSEKKLEYEDYQVITDNTDKIITYDLKNKTHSYMNIINKHRDGSIPKQKNLNEILENDELWAYYLKLEHDTGLFAFRKILKGKVGRSSENLDNSILKTIKTKFDVDSQQLEIIKDDTIFLDKQFDCFLQNDTFYVFRQTQFEQIFGIEDEFKEESKLLIEEIQDFDFIDGLELISNEIDINPSIHRKLTRLKKLGNYKNLNSDVILKMHSLGAEYGFNVKVNEHGQLKIEDKKDVELVVKLLSDFYKKGEIFGKKYGTFAGKEIE